MVLEAKELRADGIVGLENGAGLSPAYPAGLLQGGPRRCHAWNRGQGGPSAGGSSPGRTGFLARPAVSQRSSAVGQRCRRCARCPGRRTRSPSSLQKPAGEEEHARYTPVGRPSGVSSTAARHLRGALTAEGQIGYPSRSRQAPRGRRAGWWGWCVRGLVPGVVLDWFPVSRFPGWFPGC